MVDLNPVKQWKTLVAALKKHKTNEEAVGEIVCES